MASMVKIKCLHVGTQALNERLHAVIPLKNRACSDCAPGSLSTIMRAVLDVSLGSLEIAGALCGVPFVGAAAIILKDIIAACDGVRAHKKKSRQIRDKCVQLMNALNDQATSLEGSEVQQFADQVTAVFDRVQTRIRRWSRLNSVQTFLKNAEIGNGLDQCEVELDTALNLFQVTKSSSIGLFRHIEPICTVLAFMFQDEIVMLQSQREAREMTSSNHSELRELLLQVLTNATETQNIVDMQSAGEPAAERIMEAGQLELRSLRESSHLPTNLIIATERSSSPAPLPQDSQRYLQYQRGLINLHRVTGIPPTVKVLNGEVTKVGELAVAGGTYSDIWSGMWLGEEKVALKALRTIKASDIRAQKCFEHEISLWANLKNNHILPFYGVVTDLGQHMHMVSPWQENGNVLDFVKSNPEANRILLILGAAKGLEYLHSCKIVHGNVKCANILVSASGNSCICDFGMSKVIEEVTEKSASATLTAAGSARWLAPELIEGIVSSPTMAADTYSYAMAILELLTGKHPFSERKRDASVIHDIVVLKRTPKRPQEEEACIWITDDLWSLMQACWHKDALQRPSMLDVSSRLSKMETLVM